MTSGWSLIEEKGEENSVWWWYEEDEDCHGDNREFHYGRRKVWGKASLQRITGRILEGAEGQTLHHQEMYCNASLLARLNRAPSEQKKTVSADVICLFSSLLCHIQFPNYFFPLDLLCPVCLGSLLSISSICVQVTVQHIKWLAAV